MIKHVICIKLNDNSEASKNKAKEVLLSMQGKVESIKGIEVGTDVLGSAKSYDVILEVLLEDIAALDSYQNDPYHCDVVKAYVRANAAASVVIDYEI